MKINMLSEVRGRRSADINKNVQSFDCFYSPPCPFKSRLMMMHVYQSGKKLENKGIFENLVGKLENIHTTISNNKG